MDNSTDSARQSENDRRSFLKSCGRFAATVPPAMTVMLATSLTSNAIAKSTGGGGRGNGGGKHGNGGGKHGNGGGKHGKWR